MSHTVSESNILLCGSSRVGKSTLINAICQENLSKSNQSLNSNTKAIEEYSFESSFNDSIQKTIFWDTPGIESWNEDDIHNYISPLIEQIHPICMIYCASPGSFALLNHLAWIINECHKKNIFCALVCTNMWSGRNRQIVVDELCRVLNNVHPQIKSTKEDGIIYYDNVALITMVNSIEYIDEDFNVNKPQSGIDELIFGIGKCLQRDFMFAWLRTVSHNKSFWKNMSSKLNVLFQIPCEKFNNFYQHAGNFLDFLFGFNNDDYRSITDTNTKDTDESIFFDAEMIEMSEDSHKSKLKFIVKSIDLGVQLSEILAQLGSNAVKSETTNEQEIIITAKFNDDERLKAVCNLCQIINDGQVICTIVD
ncbi:unnamed protein product [Adineta steineri]|uniref:G domain-containing protein n=1 Tax=Adineta steineri TaxID=433720 RepID=A0A814YN08_9BILA|nr:unnamed protein product [Adineta steineri]CAF1265108.1 unnamed protein product [Adineta steineri]CAF3859955.1 unnamed protein product [Adineta steineri]CAF3860787.1 unnamed protein product [Adineta steineri]